MENLQETQVVTKRGILSLNIYELPSFKEARDRQNKLVVDNPFMQIIDNKAYEEAKRRRTMLRQGRFDLQNGLKTIKDTLNTFKSEAEIITDELISITKTAEEKQQAEVVRYEEAKEAEKKRKEEEENLRKEAIKKAIANFRDCANQSINSATFNTIEGIKKDIIEKNIECDDFQEDFEAVKAHLVRTVEQKHIQLQETENLRIAQEEIARERTRAMELKKYDHIYLGEDLGKISETEFLKILEIQRKLYQEMQAKKAAKDAAEKIEQEQIKEKNRIESEKLEAEKKALEIEKERIAQERRNTRINILSGIGFENVHGYYDRNGYDEVSVSIEDIDTMSNEDFYTTIGLLKTRIAEQDKIKQKLIEEKAEQEAIEAARKESIKPDKQKMIETLNTLTLNDPVLTSDETKKEWEMVKKSFRRFVIEQTTIIENI